jgi:hypothetical protein
MRTHYGPWQPCWISDQHQKHKSGRGPSNEHFWQVWLKSVQQFQRRRFKCEKLTDGRRTLTHDKSSHGLWPGELKSSKKGLLSWTELPSKLGALYGQGGRSCPQVSSGINGAKSCILGLSWHLISLLKLHFFVLFFSYFQQLFKIKDPFYYFLAHLAIGHVSFCHGS